MDSGNVQTQMTFSEVSKMLVKYEDSLAEMLRTGKALTQLPLLSEAFEKGHISSSHIREISRVATEETEQFWRDTARGKTVREVEKMVAFTPKGGLPGMKNTPKGERAVSPEVMEKALCDAEIVELDKPGDPLDELKKVFVRTCLC